MNSGFYAYWVEMHLKKVVLKKNIYNECYVVDRWDGLDNTEAK